MDSENKENIKKDAYDTTFILSSVLIFILFNVLEESLSCDVQKIIKNQYMKHIIGVVSIFFMFAVLGNKENQHIGMIWLKSFVIYFIFILMAKSQWYFSLPVVTLLLIDQSIKIQADHIKDKNDKSKNKKIDTIRKIITYSILALIGAGSVAYGVKQYHDHKDTFNIGKLLFGIGCENQLE